MAPEPCRIERLDAHKAEGQSCPGSQFDELGVPIDSVTPHKRAKAHSKVSANHFFAQSFSVSMILGKVIVCENEFPNAEAMQLLKLVTNPFDRFVILPIVPESVYIAEVTAVRAAARYLDSGG